MKKLINLFFDKGISQKQITFAVISLIFNLIYAFYNGALGVSNRSVWFMVSCVYYLLLSIMRFLMVITHKTRLSLIKANGILLLLLSFVLGIIIYISLSQNVVSKYETITMITISTFTFTKLSLAINKSVKYKRTKLPFLKAIHRISYCEVAVSIFTMQRSMIVSFGGMNASDEYFLNIMTGCLVCLFVFIMGISLIKSKGL